MPNGDRTVVGERGASLSGGQRARISLARAMYKKASIYILDDPLSAVDAHVGKHLFDEVIGPNGFVQDATRILVTHQVHFLTEADVIVIVENGKITRCGTYTELSNSDLDFAKLLQRIETEHQEDKNEDEMDGTLNDTTSSGEITIYGDDDDIPYIDGFVPNGSPYKALRRQRSDSKRSDSGSKASSFAASQECLSNQLEAEKQAEGIPWHAFSSYFLAGNSCCGIFWIAFVMIFSLMITSGCDYFVNYWTLQEFHRLHGKEVALTQLQYLSIYSAFIVGLICVRKPIQFLNSSFFRRNIR